MIIPFFNAFIWGTVAVKSIFGFASLQFSSIKNVLIKMVIY